MLLFVLSSSLRGRLTAGCASVLLLGASAACSKSASELSSDYKPSEHPLPPGPATLEKVDTKVGTGREAKLNDTVHVQYTGTLMNGKKFDSSYDHGGEPFKFTIGKGEVIKGWDEGVPGMKVGGKRTLHIPSGLGYGSKGSSPDIPPDAGLIFDIELVSID